MRTGRRARAMVSWATMGLGDDGTGRRWDWATMGLGSDELDLGDRHWAMSETWAAMKPGRLHLSGEGTWTVLEPGRQ
jgi:hypothetical protein